MRASPDVVGNHIRWRAHRDRRNCPNQLGSTNGIPPVSKNDQT
jgi:hypothetical protein